MWLINVETLDLEEHFHDKSTYAILSHTWDSGEVTFEDWNAVTRWRKLKSRGIDPGSIADLEMAAILQKPGYAKIIKCCERARRDGLGSAWVDTCAIDKSSSSALSEAINSMYQYYRSSQKCYVYLEDVPPGENPDESDSFRISRWFTRGWTLQELLAPDDVEFFDSNWNNLASKTKKIDLLSKITGIENEFLKHTQVNEQASQAERMAWASSRRTTRPEDMAYCLFGIFDVQLPILYGEGATKAFVRLQEAIISRNDDQSLLAWGYQRAPCIRVSTIFAESPELFAACGTVIPDGVEGGSMVPFQMTNKGLQITLDIARVDAALVFALLNVKDNQFPKSRLAIPLIPMRSGETCKDGDAFLRVRGQAAVRFSRRYITDIQWRRLSIFIARNPVVLSFGAVREVPLNFIITFAPTLDSEPVLEEKKPPTVTGDGIRMIVWNRISSYLERRVETQQLFFKFGCPSGPVVVAVEYKGEVRGEFSMFENSVHAVPTELTAEVCLWEEDWSSLAEVCCAYGPDFRRHRSRNMEIVQNEAGLLELRGKVRALKM